MLYRSTLELYYRQAYIDMLEINVMQQNTLYSISGTRALSESHFSWNTSFGDLLNALLVEDWHSNVSYDAYFDVCHPQICTYTVNTHRNLVYIVVTIVGITEGLSQILRFSSSLIVRWIVNYSQNLRRTRTAVVPLT